MVIKYIFLFVLIANFSFIRDLQSQECTQYLQINSNQNTFLTATTSKVTNSDLELLELIKQQKELMTEAKIRKLKWTSEKYSSWVGVRFWLRYHTSTSARIEIDSFKKTVSEIFQLHDGILEKLQTLVVFSRICGKNVDKLARPLKKKPQTTA